MVCAHAVSVTFKKMPGVQSVEVSLNRGSAILKLAPGNNVRMEDVWEGVRRNGFTPKETKVIMRGELLGLNGKPQLKVSGTNQTYELQSSLPAELLKHAGETVVIEGAMTPVKGSSEAVPVRVTSLKPAAKGA